MRRRAILAATGLAVGSAGCVVGYGRRESPADDQASEIDAPTLAEQGMPSTICAEDIKPGGIRAIDDPSFGAPGEWPDDPDGYRRLDDEATVIGIENDVVARAYPLTVLNVHEIINDTLDGPVLVTYCPLCRSGMVADRRVDGDPARFDVSGLLWVPPGIYTAAAEADGRVFSDREAGVSNNGNLVMYDETTGSYWSQMLAQAICGSEAERRLEIRSSTISTWREWRTDHPDGEVLLPPPASGVVDPPI